MKINEKLQYATIFRNKMLKQKKPNIEEYILCDYTFI